MSQSRNNPLDEDWPSFCTSCKSELRSIYSLGVPSYLNESVSSISNGLEDDSQMRDQVTVDGREKTMRSISTSTVCGRDNPLAYPSNFAKDTCVMDELPSSSQTESPKPSSNSRADYSSKYVPDRKVDGRNMSSAILLMMHKEIKLVKHVELSSDRQNLEKRKKIHDIALSKDIVKVRNMVVSNVPIDSRDIVHPEVIETDLRNHRRNIYKLAVRVSKLSIRVCDMYKVLLKKANRAGMYKEDAKKEVPFKSKVKTVNSCAKSSSPQDLPMYNYNPLQTKREVVHNN